MNSTAAYRPSASELPQSSRDLHTTARDCILPPSPSLVHGRDLEQSVSGDEGLRPPARLEAGTFPAACCLYWPSDFLESYTPSPDLEKQFLVGWTFSGGPGEVIGVVAHVVSESVACQLYSRQARQNNLNGCIEHSTKRSTDAILQSVGVIGELSRQHSGLINHKTTQLSCRPSGRELTGSTVQEWQNCMKTESLLWIEVDAPPSKLCKPADWRLPSMHRSKRYPTLPRLLSLSTTRLTEKCGKTCRPIGRLVQPPLADDFSSQTSVTVVFYTPPDHTMLRFYTLESLALTCNSFSNVKHEFGKKMESLLAGSPERWFEITGGFASRSGPGSGMRQAVERINIVRRVRILFERETCQGSKRHFDCNEQNMLGRWLRVPLKVCKATQRLLCYPIMPIRSARYSLSQVSATVEQLVLRLAQITSFSSSAASLRKLQRRGDLPPSVLSARYVDTWNGLWLIANDLILGWATGTLLMQNSDLLSAWLTPFVDSWMVQSLKGACHWLDDWPAGLKLNTQLSWFYRDMYVGLIALCDLAIVQPLQARLPGFLWTMGLIGKVGGLSMQLCFASDALRMFGFHIRWLHVIARSQYRASLVFLSHSLQLFRGRKRTVLSPRRPLVPTEYELDQLLLGTILFTLALFLFPTVAVYHYLFAASLTVIYTFVALLRVAKEVLNHLPLLALMLRLKDPERVPGGVYLVLVPGRDQSEGFYHKKIYLETMPLSIFQILSRCNSHLRPLAALPRMALGIIAGTEISLCHDGNPGAVLENTE